MKQNNLSKEELNQEYQKAKRLCEYIYVTKDYTFLVNPMSFYVLKNIDIVWINQALIYHMFESNNSKYLCIFFHTKDKKKYTTTNIVNPEPITKIQKFYAKYFPFIVTNSSEETKQLFNKEYDDFLYLKYYTHDSSIINWDEEQIDIDVANMQEHETTLSELFSKPIKFKIGK